MMKIKRAQDMRLNVSFADARSWAKTNCKHRSYRRAFTLVELLVVISIIGILVALTFPALQAVRRAARQTQCSNNIRQFAIAALAYESGIGRFPAGDNGEGGGPVVVLLPYMKQEYLHERAGEPLGASETQDQRFAELSDTQVDIFLCPSAYITEANIIDRGKFTLHYLGLAGPVGIAVASDGSNTYQYQELSPTPADGPIGLQGIFSPNARGEFKGRFERDVRDGVSYTFGFGELSNFNDELPEAGKAFAGWAFGTRRDTSTSTMPIKRTYGIKSLKYAINSVGSTTINDTPFASAHPSGAQFTFLDGAVRFITDDISSDILKTFASINEVEKPERLDE